MAGYFNTTALMVTVRDLSDEELVEQLDWATRKAHYDPQGDNAWPVKINYSKEALKTEVLRRLKAAKEMGADTQV